MSKWEELVDSFGFKEKDKMILINFLEKQEYVNIDAKYRRNILDNILKDLKAGKKVQANYKLMSKKVMDDYIRRGNWSRLELITKQILESLGLRGRMDWFHNFKIQNQKQNASFELDFYLPDYSLDIENDGDVFHIIGNADKKDMRRDQWLKRLGIKTLRLASKDFPSPKEAKDAQIVKLQTLKSQIQKELSINNGGNNLALTLSVINTVNGKEASALSEIGAKKGKRIPKRVFNALIEDLKDKVVNQIERLY